MRSVPECQRHLGKDATWRWDLKEKEQQHVHVGRPLKAQGEVKAKGCSFLRENETFRSTVSGRRRAKGHG